MDLHLLKQMIVHSPNEVSILLQGQHGLGKSTIVSQAAQLYKEELGIEETNFAYVDLRLSQNDVGDLKGAFVELGGVTFFAPPHWFPIAHKDHQKLVEKFNQCNKSFELFQTAEYGVLFLDELNRARADVQQCAFELILDRRLNGISIPPGWKIIAAINQQADLYTQVTPLDPALIDRFLVIDFNPSKDEWLEYCQNQSMHPLLISFLQNRFDLIDPEEGQIAESSEKSQKIPSRRSWTRLGQHLTHLENKGLLQMNLGKQADLELVKAISKGWVGESATKSFLQHCREQKDLGIYGLIKGYDNFMDTFVGMKRFELPLIMEKVVLQLSKLQDLDQGLYTRIAQIVTYYKDDPEVLCGFWSKWTHFNYEQALAWFDSNESKNASTYIVEAFEGYVS